MKCRLLYAKTISDPRREDNGQVMAAGTIVDHPDAYWLCHIYQQVLRKLNDDSFDLVQMDGKGHPLKYEAEPADLECLMACQKLWPRDFDGFQLKKDPPPAPEPVPAAAEETANSSTAGDQS